MAGLGGREDIGIALVDFVKRFLTRRHGWVRTSSSRS